MDSLDVRILRAMGIRPYERTPKHPDALKPSRIAEVVGATPETVKARVERMQATGVIAGYRLVPNLRHLGLSAEAYYFRFVDDDAKPRAYDAITTQPGLLEVHDFLGRGFCVDFTFREEAEREARLRAFRESTGEAKPLKFYEREMPPAQRDLTNLDWRILRALRADATRSVYDVALDVGVSGRTVKRHYDRMAEDGSFFTVPLVDPSKAEGLFLFEMLVYLQPWQGKEAMRRVLAAYRDSLLYSYVPSSPELGHFDALLFAKSTGEVEELRRAGAHVEGVARAEAWFFRGFHDHGAWLDRAIDERVEATRA